MVFYYSSNFNLFLVFPALEKKKIIKKNDDKVLGKILLTFRHNTAYIVNSFVSHFIWQLWLVAYKSYTKFSSRKYIAVTMTYQLLTLIPVSLSRIRNH